MSTPAKVVVVGGGVAGLATAWLVRARAAEAGAPIELTVLESDGVAGGHTRSDRVDGFLCEHGPNGFLDNEPRTLELVERVGLASRLRRARPEAARRYIMRAARLRELQMSPLRFLGSDAVTLGTKLRMGLEPFVPQRRDGTDESVAEFGTRRLGAGFAASLLDPMVSGIFAGDSRTLSLKAAFPKMAELEAEHGGLFRAMLARGLRARRAAKAAKAAGETRPTPRGGPAGPGGTLHTFPEGMGELTLRLASELAAAVRTGARVTAVTRDGERFGVRVGAETLAADAIVVAVPAPAAAELVAALDPRAQAALAAIPYAGVTVACRGYALESLDRPLEGFGVLVRRGEPVRALGALCSDRIFEGQAPEGARLLRVILGGAQDPGIVDLSPDELEGVVQNDLATLFGAHGAPRLRQDYSWRRGIAQYTIGHLERVAEVERLERSSTGLYFTGAAYRGVSVNGCVKDAFAVSERLVRALVAARARRGASAAA